MPWSMAQTTTAPGASLPQDPPAAAGAERPTPTRGRRSRGRGRGQSSRGSNTRATPYDRESEIRQRILSDMASFAYAERHLRRETRARMAREDEEARIEAEEAAAEAGARVAARGLVPEVNRSPTTTMSAAPRPSTRPATTSAPPDRSHAAPTPSSHDDVTMDDQSVASTAGTILTSSPSAAQDPRATTLATERRIREHLATLRPQLGKADEAEKLLEGHLEHWARPVQDPQADLSRPENFWHALPPADLEQWIHLSRQTHRGRVLKYIETLTLAERGRIDQRAERCDQSIAASKEKGEAPLTATVALKDSLWHSWEHLDIICRRLQAETAELEKEINAAMPDLDKKFKSRVWILGQVEPLLQA